MNKSPSFDDTFNAKKDIYILPAGFDGEIYLKLNPDVLKIGMDPALHYCLHGRAEGRAFIAPVLDLPDNFDGPTYLKLNPDLDSVQDPALHYCLHGRAEGRSFSMPDIHIFGEETLREDRKTILVVSHEASRTGAPILSLNIVQNLVERYNVVALLLGGGPLIAAFKHSGAVVISFSSSISQSPAVISEMIDSLSGRFDFKFAIVNSIESRLVLQPLNKHSIPSICLVHEFASCYTNPLEIFKYTSNWSSEILFSANMVLENALHAAPNFTKKVLSILPQGRCLAPLSEMKEGDVEEEFSRIRALMRPNGMSHDSVIVLGAGFVHFRKGVDLFLDCAARVLNSPGGEKCFFIWIGKGFEPSKDAAYSVYLADQIERAGLKERVLFIDETPAIEAAYLEADIFLLTSRLDPLPNVAIDAMANNLPVLCFDKTTGIADFLDVSDLSNYCVANYLDVEDMSKKITMLASSNILRKEISQKSYLASISYFNMVKYIDSLEKIAEKISSTYY